MLMASASILEQNYPEAKFGGFSSVDGTVAFYTRVRSLLPATGIVCDLGCGRGAAAEDPVAFRRDLRDLRGPSRTVIGLDVDPAARSNPLVDQFIQYDGLSVPMRDGFADIVVSDFVVEHLPDPSAYFDEAARVLKPSGYLCIRTPNLMSYFGLAARLLPARFRSGALRRGQPRREAQDIYPAEYLCNTRRTLSRYLESAGFCATVVGHEAEPAYFGFSRLLYSFMVTVHRLTPRAFVTNLFAFAERIE